MDEPKDDATILNAKEVMLLVQAIAEFNQFVSEGAGCVTIMMNVNLYIYNFCSHKRFNQLKQATIIFFLRIKEGVAGRLACGVFRRHFGNCGPKSLP
ncbi:MAG TPA: hypothetical protein VGE93_00770 [Bryobacteraceae bacterium]